MTSLTPTPGAADASYGVPWSGPWRITSSGPARRRGRGGRRGSRSASKTASARKLEPGLCLATQTGDRLAWGVPSRRLGSEGHEGGSARSPPIKWLMSKPAGSYQAR